MSKIILNVKNLNKKYRHFAVKDINFSLEEGYILGLVGRNGAGKTTIMKLIQNIVVKDSGEVLIDDLDHVNDEIKAKNKVGFIMEHPFMDRLTLLENAQLFSVFYNNYHEEQFLNYLEHFHLDGKMKFGQLSKGMQTKYQLAMALSHDAKLLIMDEPTGGLDPIFRREFLSILQEVADTQKVAIIISTHITSDLDKIADYIALVDDGELIFHKTKEEMLDQYWLVKGSHNILNKIPSTAFISIRKYSQGFEALTDQKEICKSYLSDEDQILMEHASIEDIMFFVHKGRSESV